MTAAELDRSEAGDVAREASHYLDVVELFRSLGADPHAAARARAAHARRSETCVTRASQPRTGKAVNRWRS